MDCGLESTVFTLSPGPSPGICSSTKIKKGLYSTVLASLSSHALRSSEAKPELMRPPLNPFARFPETKELPVALNKSCYFPRKANFLRLPIRLPTTNQALFMPRNLSAVDSRQQQPVHSGALGPAPAASDAEYAPVTDDGPPLDIVIRHMSPAADPSEQIWGIKRKSAAARDSHEPSRLCEAYPVTILCVGARESSPNWTYYLPRSLNEVLCTLVGSCEGCQEVVVSMCTGGLMFWRAEVRSGLSEPRDKEMTLMEGDNSWQTRQGSTWKECPASYFCSSLTHPIRSHCMQPSTGSETSMQFGGISGQLMKWQMIRPPPTGQEHSVLP
ncbi:hypothetical protein EYF80_010094 [Liparis tanakae]|uniref:Uncharacterized protein n=1 Tax=Liparis tanakae TaxID=230148 RepID=A0A4Z2INX4_9TELE|nr:hypothetical protein EYF80_010094 [Liparis tanakae]